ncbi:cation diffusion facilitator family transporter [Clostridium luticellarii]|jgi:cation diffusion facilitator family transporter|uniref:Ferrous-iron efflux pump FieF n=1 Tax=Clostridium luticellarii TaxID=1691940 RepID=A0A2T0BNM2_9CLOT|nr:cation diffusion facilitator family transporter [Clostridium luticellarii]MCI1968963.1 cation diffusion facilitator family transporter [Clostridium luticellarii]MCI1996282.1 cation diffusion facilitator family transporter [Clostridium luticellarii]MCI2040314.1 cation diffusion facilitator family transporter [Clostridium luticellarii]PRR85422.1 Ferrous-iron efflux pump FieF [Clostridium luticellarii]
MEEDYKDLKIAEKRTKVNVVVYVFLSLFKLGIGYFFHSRALFADGINNSTDIIASLAIVIGLKISRKPADEDHAYGHLRAQTVSTLVASLIMIAVGAEVFYNAVYSTIFFKAKAPDMISALVSIVCTVLVYVVYRYNRKVAVKIKSLALMAAAKDNLSDAWVSLGAACGIIASQFGFPWIDPLAAVIVGILIIKTGMGIFKESAQSLTDGFDSRQLDAIVEKINKIEGVDSVKDIKARVHGNNILLDIIIVVSSKLTVLESHRITEKIESMLSSKFKIKYAIIHVEPALK